MTKTRKTPVSPKTAGKAPTTKAQRGHRPRAKGGKAPKLATPRPRGPSKADMLVKMLQRPNGASIGELVAAFGTLPHTIRAQISIEKRKRGLTIERTGKAHYRAVSK